MSRFRMSRRSVRKRRSQTWKSTPRPGLCEEICHSPVIRCRGLAGDDEQIRLFAVNLRCFRDPIGRKVSAKPAPLPNRQAMSTECRPRGNFFRLRDVEAKIGRNCASNLPPNRPDAHQSREASRVADPVSRRLMSPCSPEARNITVDLTSTKTRPSSPRFQLAFHCRPKSCRTKSAGGDRLFLLAGSSFLVGNQFEQHFRAGRRNVFGPGFPQQIRFAIG